MGACAGDPLGVGYRSGKRRRGAPPGHLPQRQPGQGKVPQDNLTSEVQAIVNRVLEDRGYGFAQTKAGEAVFIPPTVMDANALDQTWVGFWINFTVVAEPKGYRALAILPKSRDPEPMVAGLPKAKVERLLELLRRRREAEDDLEDLLDELLEGQE